MILGGLERTATARCDRRYPHPAHEYVATAASPVVLDCPGVMPRRSVSQLVADDPAYGAVGAGGVGHVLAVMAA